MSNFHTILSRAIHITFSSALAIACMLTACDEPEDDENVEELLAELEPADEPEAKYFLKETNREEIMVELETQAALYAGEEHPAERAMTCGWGVGGECAWCAQSGCVGWACNDGSSGGCCFDKYGDCY